MPPPTATSSLRASQLYDRFGLRRVYYSAPSRPIPDASAVLPLKRPPLMREHRLYQSDWLMRFYGFKPKEVVARDRRDGMLPLDIDPKLAWALKFREQLPGRRQPRAARALLRVPGLGTKAVGAHPHGRALARAAARRRRAADGVDRQGAAVHRRRRLAPDVADRPRRPAERWSPKPNSELFAARIVR